MMPAMTAQPAAFDLSFTLDLLLRLLNTPSPTGFTDAAVRLLAEMATFDEAGVGGGPAAEEAVGQPSAAQL